MCSGTCKILISFISVFSWYFIDFGLLNTKISNYGDYKDQRYLSFKKSIHHRKISQHLFRLAVSFCCTILCIWVVQEYSKISHYKDMSHYTRYEMHAATKISTKQDETSTAIQHTNQCNRCIDNPINLHDHYYSLCIVLI